MQAGLLRYVTHTGETFCLTACIYIYLFIYLFMYIYIYHYVTANEC